MLLRAWIARGAVWCPPQARHGLSITHLSAGCQGFEALSKACSCSEQRAKTVWKCLHRYTQGQPHAKRSGTARRRGSSASVSDSLQPPPPHEWIPTPQLADHRHLLRCQWHIRCCRNNAAREKILACADALGTGHARPEKNHGEVRAQLRRARGGVRREHEGGGFERHFTDIDLPVVVSLFLLENLV